MARRRRRSILTPVARAIRRREQAERMEREYEDKIAKNMRALKKWRRIARLANARVERALVEKAEQLQRDAAEAARGGAPHAKRRIVVGDES